MENAGRNCTVNNRQQNWVKRAAGETERIEACFSGLAYAPHSHDHPDETHDGQAGTESPFAYRAITINPVEVQNILQGSSLPFLPGGVTNHPNFVQIARQLLAELHRPLETLEQQELIFAFANCLQQSTSGTVQHTRANYQAIKRVREYIDDMMSIHSTLSVDISLDELAAISQYSKWQVTRDFRSLYGTTPYRYITVKRLQKAKKLLELGLPLVQVAIDSGFADQSHFTRHFKQCFGTTPKVWTKLHQ